MQGRHSILIVDDDALLRTLVAGALHGAGFVVHQAADRAAAEKSLDRQRPDLILLDISLPGDNGLAMMEALRARCSRLNDEFVPIVMLTAKSSLDDRIVGLERGADDYICKPVDMRELVARVRSICRRFARTAAAAPRVLAFREFILDTGRRQVRRPGGGEIPLTSGEFDLLSVFADRPNRPLNRDELLERTRARDWNPYDRSIDILVGRLRKKIEPDPRQPQIIKTVRGVGYVFAPEAGPVPGPGPARPPAEPDGQPPGPAPGTPSGPAGQPDRVLW